MKKAFEGDTILQAMLEEVVRRYSIDTVVETGTETGATAAAFAGMVDKVYTVDLENKVDRELPLNVFRHLADSVEFLDALLPDLCACRRPLFYLDAHLAPHFTRVLAELELIAAQSCPDIVVVIHDFQVPGKPDLGFDSYTNIGPLCEDLVRPFMDRIFPGGWMVTYNSEAEGAKRGAAIFSPL